MEQELLSHLFKPFTQVDNSSYNQSSGSLGLGLSIVKGIVDMHKGSVIANSEGLGKGTLFTVQLPIITEDIKYDVPGTANSRATWEDVELMYKHDTCRCWKYCVFIYLKTE